MTRVQEIAKLQDELIQLNKTMIIGYVETIAILEGQKATCGKSSKYVPSVLPVQPSRPMEKTVPSALPQTAD